MTSLRRSALYFVFLTLASCALGCAHTQEARVTQAAPDTAATSASVIDRIHVDERNDRPLDGQEFAESREALAQWLIGYTGGEYAIVASRYFEVRNKSGVNWAFAETYFDQQARTHFGGERERHAWHSDGVGAASLYTVADDPARRVVVATPQARLPNGHMLYGIFELQRK